MITSRTSRAPRLLAGIAAAAVASGTLALVAPAHAAPPTPWQLGFDHTYATALSADGSHVYAVGSTTPDEGPEVYTFDSVDTATGAVDEQTLDFGEQDQDADTYSQEDAFAIATDGTLFVSGYHASPSEFGTDYTGILWTFTPDGDGSPATTSLIDGFGEISALGLHDETLVLGGTDPDYAPAIQVGQAADYAADEADYTTFGISDSTSASVDAIAIGGDIADDNLAVWVAGRTYEQDGEDETVSNVVWRVTSPTDVTSFPLAAEAASITATASHGYVGEISWDDDNSIGGTSLQSFPAAQGAVTSLDLQGNVPYSLAISPDGAKVIGVGYGTTFAVDVAAPTTTPIINNYANDGSIDLVAFSASRAYAVVDVSDYDSATDTWSTTKKVEAMTTLPWNAPPVVDENPPAPPAPPVANTTPPAPHLTPAQQKIANAQAKLTHTNAAIAQAKAAAKAAKKAHNKAAAKKAAKQIAKLKKTLKKQKAAVTKAKKAAKKAAAKKAAKKKH